MAKQPDNGARGAAAADEAKAAEAKGPQISVLAQYVKDFSFENPQAPQIYDQLKKGMPGLGLAVNVNAKPMSATDVEVELKVEARAGEEKSPAFAVELTYAGVFRIQNASPQQIHPLAYVECPRLLFPFVRQMIADVTLQGGFPPILLQPMDFGALYRQRLAEMAKQGEGAATA